MPDRVSPLGGESQPSVAALRSPERPALVDQVRRPHLVAGSKADRPALMTWEMLGMRIGRKAQPHAKHLYRPGDTLHPVMYSPLGMRMGTHGHS